MQHWNERGSRGGERGPRSGGPSAWGWGAELSAAASSPAVADQDEVGAGGAHRVRAGPGLPAGRRLTWRELFVRPVPWERAAMAGT